MRMNIAMMDTDEPPPTPACCAVIPTMYTTFALMIDEDREMVDSATDGRHSNRTCQWGQGNPVRHRDRPRILLLLQPGRDTTWITT